MNPLLIITTPNQRIDEDLLLPLPMLLTKSDPVHGFEHWSPEIKIFTFGESVGATTSPFVDGVFFPYLPTLVCYIIHR